MISERTLEFVGRLAVSLAVFGSVLGLAAVGTSSIVAFLAREEVKTADDAVRLRTTRLDLFTPVEERIRSQQAMIGQLKDPEVKKEEERYLASLYKELGKRSFELRQFPRAEEAFQKSVALDPENPVYLTDLASLYAAAAVRQAEKKLKLTLLRSSSDCWESAASHTPDAGQRQTYEFNAASTRFGAALELSQVGLHSEARRELYRARSLAEQGSPLAQQIDVLLSQVGG